MRKRSFKTIPAMEHVTCHLKSPRSTADPARYTLFLTREPEPTEDMEEPERTQRPDKNPETGLVWSRMRAEASVHGHGGALGDDESSRASDWFVGEGIPFFLGRELGIGEYR
jgi:hypothetical protein